MAIELDITDNSPEVMNRLNNAILRALNIVGMKAETYAKARCPVGTPESTGKKGYRGGTLRNSITFNVTTENGDHQVTVGSNVEYAPYVELGTGPYFDTPPAWIKYTTTQGSGLSGGYVRPRPYLKPAIVDHLSEYEQIIENELRRG